MKEAKPNEWGKRTKGFRRPGGAQLSDVPRGAKKRSKGTKGKNDEAGRLNGYCSGKGIKTDRRARRYNVAVLAKKERHAA